MNFSINRGLFRLFIIYAVIVFAVFGYFSWTEHWYKTFEDRYYAYIPEESFIAICHPCEDVKYLENSSGILVGFGTDFSQVAKISKYGGEPREIGSSLSNVHVYAAIEMHLDEPLVEGKFIPISIQIMENGNKKLLTGKNVGYEEKMKSLRSAAKEMRAESDNILKNAIRDLLYLLALLVMPILLYALVVWVRNGFNTNTQ